MEKSEKEERIRERKYQIQGLNRYTIVSTFKSGNVSKETPWFRCFTPGLNSGSASRSILQRKTSIDLRLSSLPEPTEAQV